MCIYIYIYREREIICHVFKISSSDSWHIGEKYCVVVFLWSSVIISINEWSVI